MQNRNIKITILDDDLFFGTLISRFLANLGYSDITHFINEDECLAEAQEDLYCIYILDQELDATSGIEIMKEIQKINNKAVFIFLSGQEYCHIAIKALREGATDYIEKNNSTLSDLDKILNFVIDSGYEDSKEYNRLAV